MDSLLNNFRQNLQKTLQVLKDDIKIVRTGRATPALIENLIVETYAGQTKLKLMELATIMTEGSTALVVIPFDVSTIADIEKAVLKSSLGFSPQTQATKIVIKIPPLSQEQREKFIKLVHSKIEERKNIVRNQRDEVRRRIKSDYEKKIITEDTKFRIEKEIDNITHQIMEEIQKVKEIKEKEIMAV